jgi:hypothetical protein
MVVALILLFEWVVPWMSDRPMDWGQFVFACIFGMQVVILHTALAYVRPPTEAETIVMVEHAMHEAEERRRLAPGITLPRTPQMAAWAANDPRWEKLTETTEVEVPVLRPLTKRL